MRLKSTMRTAAVAVVVLAVTAACAGGGATGAQGGGTPDPTATFTWAFSVGPSTLDPHDGTSQRDLNTLWPVYDRLTLVNERGEIEPMLAQSWELAADGSTFTLHLRPGVTFSDGAPLTAEAVKLSLERGMTKARSTDFRELDAIIGSINPVDDLTVKLNLEGPGGVLPTLLGSRTGMIVSPLALNNPDLARAPVGAGAMVLVESDPGVRYVYERRPDYWNPEAYKFAKLVVLIQPDDSTRLNAVRSGQIDATNVRETQVDEASAGGLQIVSGVRIPFYSLAMNTARSEFEDKRVRQALSMAIDRGSISDSIFDGLCTPTVQPFPEGYFAHGDDTQTQGWGEYNPEKAKELLREAGLPNGFEFTAIVPTVTGYQTLAEVLKEQLAAIGVRMNLQPVDSAQAPSMYASGGSDGAVSSYSGDVDPSIYYSSTYLRGARNPGGQISPEVERLQGQALQSEDPAVRGRVYNELLGAVFEQGLNEIPICFLGGNIAGQTDVSGLEAYVTGMYDFRDVTVSKR